MKNICADENISTKIITMRINKFLKCVKVGNTAMNTTDDFGCSTSVRNS